MTQNVLLRQYTDIFNTLTNKRRRYATSVNNINLPVREKNCYFNQATKNLKKTKMQPEIPNKSLNKQRAANDPKFCVAIFDLEKVLTTPQGEASNFYYKRKCAVYNFTVYDIVNKVGYCYMWDKSEEKRGSNETGTSLLKFLKTMKKGFKEFCFYSDSCGGQNRH